MQGNTFHPEPLLARWYKYCPSCQQPLKTQYNRYWCESCGFESYLNPNPTTAMVFYRGDEVLLVKRGIEPKKGSWDVPGGFVDFNESAEECMSRELQEELAISIPPQDLIYLGSLYDTYGQAGKACLWTVYAFPLTSETELQPGDDVEELRWFHLDEVPSDLAFTGVSVCINLFQNYRKLHQNGTMLS